MVRFPARKFLAPRQFREVVQIITVDEGAEAGPALLQFDLEEAGVAA